MTEKEFKDISEIALKSGLELNRNMTYDEKEEFKERIDNASTFYDIIKFLFR